jgi:hypothetical protein
MRKDHKAYITGNNIPNDSNIKHLANKAKDSLAKEDYNELQLALKHYIHPWITDNLPPLPLVNGKHWNDQDRPYLLYPENLITPQYIKDSRLFLVKIGDEESLARAVANLAYNVLQHGVKEEQDWIDAMAIYGLLKRVKPESRTRYAKRILEAKKRLNIP